MSKPHLMDRFGGPAIRLRGLESRDRDAHTAHLLRLSPQDRRARFHSGLSDQAVIAYSHRIDWENALIFGAFVDKTLHGVAELQAIGDGSEAEVSFSIETEYQNIGLGRRLVLAAVLAARRAGFRQIHMDFTGHNQAMRALARDLGAVTDFSDGVVHAVKTIPFSAPAAHP